MFAHCHTVGDVVGGSVDHHHHHARQRTQVIYPTNFIAHCCPSVAYNSVIYPMDFELQLGAQLSHPQELTLVSDWGEIVQVTTLQLERRRV
ncbi:hypothetical protein D3C80_1349510 [compost metagenome]